MPAAPPGTIIMTVPDDSGNVAIQVTLSFDPTTLAFNNPAATVINNYPAPQGVVFTLTNGVTQTQTVPAGTTNVTPQQLSNVGITSWSALNGVSFGLA